VGYSESDNDPWCCKKTGELLVITETNEINTVEGRDDEVPRLALVTFFSPRSDPPPYHFYRSPHYSRYRRKLYVYDNLGVQNDNGEREYVCYFGECDDSRGG